MTKRVVVALLMLLPAAGCFAQIGSKIRSSESLAGVWENKEFGYTMTLLLLDNGSGEFDGESIKHQTNGDRLIISSSAGSVAYKFVMSGSKLTLSEGDLDGPITFTKNGEETNVAASGPAPADPVSGNNNPILGRWEAQGQVLDFRAEQVVIDGAGFQYQLSGKNITLITGQGPVQLQYEVKGNSLIMSGPGGSVTYSKAGTGSTQASQSGGNAPIELAGKWCYVNVATTGSGGWSTDECITLHENGTYEYYSENSGSATVTNQYGEQLATGGTNSQSSDSGTWSVQGNMITATSYSGTTQSFTLERRNHPRNGDPMIVLNGKTYVTQYQKPPWR